MEECVHVEGEVWSTEMAPRDYEKLLEDLQHAILTGGLSVGVLGLTGVTLRLIASLRAAGLLGALEAVYTTSVVGGTPPLPVPVRPFTALKATEHDVLVVGADEEKEDLLNAALPFVRGTPKVILAGYGHLKFRDTTLEQEVAKLHVPSLANGYPHTVTHLYQCLANAARLDLRGVVAEFGVFKGGTTILLSRLIERLGVAWQVIGFDTFDGFPDRRSVLDMYAHPGCIFKDLEAVRQHVSGRDIEIVPGDIVETCHRLDTEDVVLTFIDTDNYTPAKAAIDVVRERTLVGGAIVFDHFTGVDRFRYTLGERLAGKVLLDDKRYFNLHGTGVFYRQC